MLIHRNDRLPQVEIKVSEKYDEYACRLHSHREYSLGIIHKGITVDNIPGKTIRLGKNDTILFPPEVLHLCNPDKSRPFSFTMIYMEKNWFESAFLDNSNTGNIRFGHLNESQLELLQELSDSFSRSQTDLKSWEEDFIQFTGELLEFQEEESYPSTTINGINELVEKIRVELEDCSVEQRSLDDMAADAGISRYSLIRRFRKSYGLPPHAYLQNRRIRYCIDALKEGQEMSRIAQDAGFTDQSHMIKIFRLYTGMTPGEYLLFKIDFS